MHVARELIADRLATRLTPDNLERLRDLVPAWVDEAAKDYRESIRAMGEAANDQRKSTRAPRKRRHRGRNHGRSAPSPIIDFDRWQVAGASVEPDTRDLPF